VDAPTGLLFMIFLLIRRSQLHHFIIKQYYLPGLIF